MDTVTFEKFGGLNLLADPFEVGAGAAVDLVNVDFDKQGRVRTRDGFARIASVTMTTPYSIAAYNRTVGARQLILGYDASGTQRFHAYSSTGTSVASQTVTIGEITGAVLAGTASTEYFYVANGADTLWRWTGSAWSQPASMPDPIYLARAPVSGRLVAANLPGNTSRVMFSAADNPESWPANNYVDLVMGDGQINALVAWGTNLYAFKGNRHFIFYGESTDADGNPIFNYRPVEGHGALDAAAGFEGVYFTDGRSVWVTTGGQPTRISEPIEPYLRGQVTLASTTVDLSALANSLQVTYSVGRLFFSVPITGGGTRTLVFDPQSGTWTLYSLDLSRLCESRAGVSRQESYFLSSAGMEKFDGTTTDNGTAIDWSYKSGRYPLAERKRVAITPASSLVGSGTVTLALDSDCFSTQTGSVTLGTAPAVAEGWPTAVDQEGTWLQYTLSGTGPASVSQLVHEISFVKPVGVR